MRVPPSQQKGFTFIELIIVITVIGLLLAIGVPWYMRARDNAALNSIYKNLRQIEVAKTQWALENKKNAGDPVANISTLSNYFASGKVRDVVREKYVPNAIGTPAEADLPAGTSLGTNAPGGVIEAP